MVTEWRTIQILFKLLMTGCARFAQACQSKYVIVNHINRVVGERRDFYGQYSRKSGAVSNIYRPIVRSVIS